MTRHSSKSNKLSNVNAVNGRRGTSPSKIENFTLSKLSHRSYQRFWMKQIRLK